MLTSFAPVISATARVVILGSMPGELSLQTGQYYAHPRNLFWPLMHELVGIRPDWPHERRLAGLRDAGIGLWDVLQHCDRKGSLDSKILERTEVANDFRSIRDRYPTLRALCFNGRKAEGAFRRHVDPTVLYDLGKPLDMVTLPSTSPANTAKSWTVKVEQWRAVLDYIQ